MSTIRVGDNENLENALRRFKRKCSRDGIIGDLRKKRERRRKQPEREAETKDKNRNGSYGFFLAKNVEIGRKKQKTE